MILKIKERIQAGDTLLFRFNCPKCNEELLTSFPFVNLKCCGSSIEYCEIKIKYKRLLSGTRRIKQIRKSLIQKLLVLSGGLCEYCSCKFIDTGYHIDHIMPLAAGGTNNIDNLCLSCPKCNLIAGSKCFKDRNAKKDYILQNRGLI